MARARPRRYTTEQAMEFIMNYDSDEMMMMWPHFVCVPCFIVHVVQCVCILYSGFHTGSEVKGIHTHSPKK